MYLEPPYGPEAAAPTLTQCLVSGMTLAQPLERGRDASNRIILFWG